MNTITQMMLSALAMGVTPPALRAPKERRKKYWDIPAEEQEQWLKDHPADAARLVKAWEKRSRKIK